MTDHPNPPQPETLLDIVESRTDVDGLLPCPFCGSDPVCNSRPGGVMGQIYCSNADCFGPKTTAFYRHESIKQWNTRAILPTRDGAEGAGGSIAMSCCATDEQIAAHVANQAAPPKPAPLQTELRKLVDVVWNEATESTAVPSTNWADRLIARVFPSITPPSLQKAQTTAAVPLPEGAIILQARNAEGGLWFEIDPEQLEWMAKNGHDVRALYPAELRSSFPPSPAVAAEPVAWPDHPGATVDAVAFVEGVKRYPNMDRDAPDLTLADKQAACQGAFINGFKRAMKIRSPPVRGDREAIAKWLWEYLYSSKGFDFWADVSEETREMWRGVASAFILFLSQFQPSAGEAFYAILKKYIPQEPIDQAWQELKEAGLVK